MKKEFSTLIQFIIVVGLSAVFSGLLLPVHYPEISVEALEGEISDLKYWIYSFTCFSVIRFGVFYFISRKAFVDPNKSLLKVFFGELAKTFQYFIIAVFSTFGAFWLLYSSLHSGGGFSHDPISLWFGIWYSSFIWLTAFSVLSLLRLGIILIWNYLSHNKKSAGL